MHPVNVMAVKKILPRRMGLVFSLPCVRLFRMRDGADLPRCYGGECVRTGLGETVDPTQQKQSFPESGNCPYCRFEIRPHPRKKRKCPSCKNTIHLKTAPGEPDKQMLTTEQAEAVERQWSEYHRSRKIERWLVQIQSSRTEYDHKFQDLSDLKCREPHDSEVLLSIIEEQLTSLQSQSARIDRLYKASILADYFGADFLPYLKRYRYETLQQYLSAGCQDIKIDVKSPRACKECRHLDEMNVTLADEIARPKVPPPDCDCKSPSGRHGWCYCFYEAEIVYAIDQGGEAVSIDFADMNQAIAEFIGQSLAKDNAAPMISTKTLTPRTGMARTKKKRRLEITCRECNRIHNAGLKYCPHCGIEAVPPKVKKVISVLLFLLIGMTFLIVLGELARP